MRIVPIAAVSLLLAACSTTTPVPVVPQERPAPATPSAPAQRGPLIGLDGFQLGARLGAPRLRVREGDGTKLQFARGSCILDAYLYPQSGGGSPRVTHIDTRNRDGRPVPQAECIRTIEGQ